MHGLHDSIHRSLLVQSRGALSAGATAYLRTGLGDPARLWGPAC